MGPGPVRGGVRDFRASRGIIPDFAGTPFGRIRRSVMGARQWREAVGRLGRRACYEQWVREHARDLHRFAYRLCGDADTAEDLVQETFYQAWKGRGSLHHSDRARAWLFQILRHRYSHWARDRSRTPPVTVAVPDRDAEAFEAPPVPAPADGDFLQSALNALDERFRTPLLMVFVQGLTCRETADQLDLPLGTVLSRIHRARKRLRIALSDQEQSPAQDAPDELPRVFRPDFGQGGEP